jgi:hypothetical protein
MSGFPSRFATIDANCAVRSQRLLRSLQIQAGLVHCRLRGELLPCQDLLSLVLKLIKGNLVFGMPYLGLHVLVIGL